MSKDIVSSARPQILGYERGLDMTDKDKPFLEHLSQKDIYISNIITNMADVIFDHLSVQHESEMKIIYANDFETIQNYLPNGEKIKYNPYNQISIGTSIKYGNVVKIAAGFLEFYLANKANALKIELNNGALELPTYIKEKIDHFLETDQYANYNINLNKGLLIHGKPGNGKTNILRYIQSRFPQESEIIRDNEIKHDSWKLTHMKYQLFDDIDLKIFEENNPVYNTVISMMDSCSKDKYIRVFTTNSSISSISPAVFRPGRISLTLEIHNPLLEDRLRYFSDLNECEKIAEITDGYSYAELNFFKVCLIDSSFNLEEAKNLYENRILVCQKKKKVGFLP